MAEDIDPTIEAQDEAPAEDSPAEAPTDDSGENSPSDTTPIDWEARFRATQAAYTRQQQAYRRLEDQFNRYARQPAAEEESSDELGSLPPQVAREIEELRAFRQEQEWVGAASEMGQPVVDAYARFYDGFQRDNTPKGALTAFIEAIQYLAENAPASEQAPRKTRSQAVQPRVDTNRSDAPDIADLDSKIEAAKAGKGKDPLASFIGNSLKKAGLVY